MTKERTDTRQFKLLAEGTYTFTVEKKPEKFRTEKSTYRKWFLSYLDEMGGRRQFRKILFPWNSKDLLLALGGIEITPDEIEWDDTEVIGKIFKAIIVHRPDRQGTIREEFEKIQSLDAINDMEIKEEQ